MSAVPAWKRLGLKLKGASSDGSPTTSTVAQTNASSAPPAGRFAQQRPNSTNAQYDSPGFNKRKQFPSSSYSGPADYNKRPRWDDSNSTPSKKSVSFSQDTKKAAPKKAKPKQKKASKPQPVKQPHDLTPSLEYLRAWDKSRETWKFNKNHQTLLLKYLYDANAIPASDINTFYRYIRDIQGASRKRLVDQAEEIRKKDMADGAKGFPEGTQGAEEKQQQYEELLASLLKSQADLKDAGDVSSTGSKRSFDEVSLVDRTKDKDVQHRLVKRMRAEMVTKELESSDDGEGAAATSAASTANAASSRVRVPVTNGDDAQADGAKQKTKRRKKLRTADSDSSSSSDSDSSDSDSDSEDEAAGAKKGSSSSSSSSDSESDEEAEAENGGDDSSSSSSSSDSESGQAGAAVSDDEDTSGSDGDSESSDSDDEA